MARLLKPFEYFKPETITEAVQLLSQYSNRAKVLAGGTDLLISMKRRQISTEYLLSIKGIPNLDYIQYSQETGLKIGALTTHSAVACSPIIKDNFKLLATACDKVGTPQIRNMGTIGGNICKAGPSQDTPPVLLALDARLKLVGPDKERIVPVEQFFLAPFKTALRESELLTEVQVPVLPPRSTGCYKWYTKAVTVDETLVGVAVIMSIDVSGVCCDIKIGLSSVAPTPLRAKQAEEVLRDKKVDNKLIDEAAQVAAEEIKPRSRPDYRLRMTRGLVAEAITETWGKLR